MKQSSNVVFMVRPSNFGYNEETASNNTFQSRPGAIKSADIQKLAVIEFDQFISELRQAGVTVIVYDDSKDPVKPDAIFPNNWFTTHEDGSLITYSMFAPNRRFERDEDILKKLSEHYDIKQRYSFEQYEKENLFLEGTGSMVLDRQNKTVYACLSPRTHISLLDKFCLLRGYRMVTVHAEDEKGLPIYHTNVMMALGSQFAIVCLEVIKEKEERNLLRETLNRSGKTIIEITESQMKEFAGNMLEVTNNKGEAIIVMSRNAKKSLTKPQLKRLSDFGSILSINIPTIETYGGGSVRCMMAEIFLSKK